MEVRLDVRVDVRARLLDDVGALASESREPEERLRSRLRPFLRVFAPIGSDLILDDDLKPGLGEGRLDVYGDEVVAHQRKVLPDQQFGLLRLQEVGGEDGEDDQASAKAENARHLSDPGVEVFDNLDHVPAPDEIERVVGERNVMHSAFDKLNSISKTGLADPLTRLFDETAQRIEPNASCAGSLNQLDQMRSVPAPHIENAGTLREPLDPQRQHRVRAARIETLVEAVVDVPGFRPVDTRYPA